jgi:hypothetical protein
MSFFKNLFGKKSEAGPAEDTVQNVAPVPGLGTMPEGSGPGDELEATNELAGQVETDDASFVFEKIIWTHTPDSEQAEPTVEQVSFAYE